MGCPPVRKIIHSLKLVDYLHVQAGNPWYNYYISPCQDSHLYNCSHHIYSIGIDGVPYWLGRSDVKAIMIALFQRRLFLCFFSKLIIPIKVSKVAKIRNRYNQVPHLTQDTTMDSDKNTIIHERAKRLALSQQVTARLQ